MKLTFVGVKPSQPLQRLLLANGFGVTYHATVPKGFSPKKTDLVAVMARDKGFPELIKKWRSQAPHVWIAVVVTKPWFTIPAKINLLIQCEEKNDVWIKDVWEQMFWFSLQKYFQYRHVTTRLAELNHRSQDLVAKLEKDVALASSVQRSLLPKVSPEIPGVNVAVKYMPSQGLGGDYYDIFEFEDRKKFGIVLADSKGHGMAATLLSVLLKVRIEEMKERFPDSLSFMNYLTEEIQQVHKKDMPPMSLLYGVLDRTTLQFTYTSAGEIRPLVWRGGEALDVAHESNTSLGGTEPLKLRETSVSLRPGDLLLLHTDGLMHVLSARKKKPIETLVEVLKAQPRNPDPLEVRNELLALVDSYTDKTPLEDDLTLIHLAVDDRILYMAKNARA